MMISLIAAMDRNRLIGNNNQLPWHLPADFSHFKSTTMGKPVIMGRKTYESIGKPLPGRTNIVLSRDPDTSFEGVECVSSFEEAVALAAAGATDAVELDPQGERRRAVVGRGHMQGVRLVRVAHRESLLAEALGRLLRDAPFVQQAISA